MIQKLKNIPVNMIGFEVEQSVTRQEFDSFIMPEIEALIGRIDQLNLLLVYNGGFENFNVGLWLSEAMERLHYMTKWKQVAVISDTEVVHSLVDLFPCIMPGEFRAFNKTELTEATN